MSDTSDHAVEVINMKRIDGWVGELLLIGFWWIVTPPMPI